MDIETENLILSLTPEQSARANRLEALRQQIHEEIYPKLKKLRELDSYLSTASNKGIYV